MYDLIVIGGGAAGFFCAINYAEINPGVKVLILEAGVNPLAKVKISGGGRCNLTHACFEPKELINYYPRGIKELLGPFNRFGPSETIAWFEAHGVDLKTEVDGRMFPASNSSDSIVQCFLKEIDKNKIKLRSSCRALFFEKVDNGLWSIKTNSEQFTSRNLFIGSGSDNRIWQSLVTLNHTLVSPVPSLFTFNVAQKEITSLQGISLPKVSLLIKEINFQSQGSLLITHWGFSGPAILKLSSWAARELHAMNYKFELQVNWIASEKIDTQDTLNSVLSHSPKKLVINTPLFDISSRLWKFLCARAEISPTMQWNNMTLQSHNKFVKVLTEDIYSINGKSTFKEEFVTAGGVELKEINFKNFESKKVPGLFLAGEVLNIDALTGGFNFQAAWTGAYLAAQGML